MRGFLRLLPFAAFLLAAPALRAQQSDVIIVDSSATLSLAQEQYNLGVLQAERGNHAGAIEAYGRALGFEPAFQPAFLNRAASKIALGDKVGAEADYKAAIAASLDSSRGGYYLALLYRESNRQAEAYEQMAAHLKRYPDDAPAHHKVGTWRFEEGDYTGAMQSFDAAITAKPSFAEALNDRGSCKRQLGDLEGAVRDYKASIIANDKLAYVHNNLGSTFRLLEKYDQAIQYHTSAIQLEGSNAVFYNNRGRAYFLKGQYDKALADFDQAIKLDSRYAMAYTNRGSALFEQNKFELAVRSHTMAIEADPKLGAAYLNRGIVREMMRDEKGACADWKQAVDLGLRNANTYYNQVCTD